MNVKVFRVASRSEGDYVNFYFAGPDDMKDALLLLSVRKSVVDVMGWKFFSDAAVQAVQKGMEVVGIKAADWKTEPAPEHERSGNA